MFDTVQVLNTHLGGSFTHGQKEYNVLCPFHADHDPSLYVNERGLYFCPVCEASGADLNTLIARMYGVPIFTLDGSIDSVAILTESGVQCERIEPACTPEQLHELYERNLAMAKQYAMGDFAGDKLAYTSWDVGLPGARYMFARGILKKTLYKHHCACWERFPRHPIFMPLMFDNEVLGYMQRRIQGYVIPKYLTMPGLEKSKCIYGYTNNSTTVLVTEGKPDQMMADQYGWLDGQAAILGSAMSDEQAKLLADTFDTIYLAFNEDKAGRSAYRTAVEKLAPYQKRIYDVRLPANDIAVCTKGQFHNAVNTAN